jgi:hypothetical protein
MTTPVGSLPPSDIRWQFELGGGALMDMTYVLSSTRHALDAGAPVSVVSAKARPFYNDSRVDEAMEATLVFRKGSADGGQGEYDVTSKIYADMRRGNVAGLIPRLWELPTIEVETELAKITYYNFMMPHVSLPLSFSACDTVCLTMNVALPLHRYHRQVIEPDHIREALQGICPHRQSWRGLLEHVPLAARDVRGQAPWEGTGALGYEPKLDRPDDCYRQCVPKGEITGR